MIDFIILIVVIVLVLWLFVFLVFCICYECKKCRDCLDCMIKEDLEDIGMEELVIVVFKKIGCQLEINEEGYIVFKY